MKYCTSCKTVAPAQAAVCPKCGGGLNVFGSDRPAVVPDAASAAQATETEQLQLQLQSLEGRLHTDRRLSWLLSVGTCGAIGCGLLLWLVYFWTTVMAYARLQPEIQIERDASDPERLLIAFTPYTAGEVGFRRISAGRETELLDMVTPKPDLSEHKLEWRWSGVQAGDSLTVTYRDGRSLVTKTVAVPKAPEKPAEPDTVAAGASVKRTLWNRAKWIHLYGGSEESEAAVEAGLDWLSRHQATDGRWADACLNPSSSDFCCRQQSKPCRSPFGAYDMAHTGLALLAFQGAGHYDFNQHSYSDVVRRGLNWMVEHQRDDGGLLGPQNHGNAFEGSYMYEHGIATFALAEACAVATTENWPQSQPYYSALEKAIRFIESHQHDDGGWRYSPHKQEAGDTSVTGWQVLAVKTAKDAGIAVSQECLQKIREFFKDREVGRDGRTAYTGKSGGTDAMTGVGMLVQQFLLHEPDSDLVEKAATYLAKHSKSHARETNYYTWYNCTLAMYQAGGNNWAEWNGEIRDSIVKLQDRDGCERGSWSPSEQWASRGGRIYSTALAVLTLEVYYRYTSQGEEIPNAPER